MIRKSLTSVCRRRRGCDGDETNEDPRQASLECFCRRTLISTAAPAADLALAPPPPIAAPAFNWAGAYVGTFGGFTPAFATGRFGVQFGYNFVLRGNILAGIEVETGNTIATLTDASLNARLGFIARDRILLYAEAGIGTQVAVPLINVGGGVEIAVGGDMSLFAEAKGLFVVGGGFFGTTYAAGLNFHPGGSMMAA